jgi:hypothetical protein
LRSRDKAAVPAGFICDVNRARSRRSRAFFVIVTMSTTTTTFRAVNTMLRPRRASYSSPIDVSPTRDTVTVMSTVSPWRSVFTKSASKWTVGKPMPDAITRA